MRRRTDANQSEHEERFALHARASGLLLGMLREYRFCPPRMWRFDFAWPERKLAVEIEGGTWSGGRHTRGSGFAADCSKYNAATMMGWRVLRYPAERVRDGTAVAQVASMLRRE